jgi:2-polyprenyl-3-methyl-5-hydroxy-6-metoxy-1,4-benzoquinol methylase
MKCSKCNILYTSSDVSIALDDINRNIYSEIYLRNIENRQHELEERFKIHIAYIISRFKKGKILDIGCSSGLFLSLFNTHNWKLFGIDINTLSINYAKKKINANFYNTTLENKHFPSNYFECVTLFDVLEHEQNYLELLHEVYRILKPNGLIIIQSPNYNSVIAKLSDIYWDWWSVPDHKIHFSFLSLINILLVEKYKIVKSYTWESKDDFVKIITGSYKSRITKFLYLNKVISKIAIYPLTFLWYILQIVNKFTNLGGLSVIYATK